MNRKNKKLLSKMNNEKKRSSLEKIKRKRRKELFFIVTLFLVVTGSIAFMFSDYVKLKNIEVQGYNQITEEEILQAGNINSSLRTWSIKDDEIADNIKRSYNIFKNVTVKSSMPSSIKISVEEYRFIAKNIKDDGTEEIIMENGVTYTGTVRNNYNLPILENFGGDESKLKEVYKNLVELKNEVLIQISEIINEDDDTLTIYMNDGQKVKVLRADFYEKLNYYDEMSKYIADKNETTLNLVHGAYLETTKSTQNRDRRINNLLRRNGVEVTEGAVRSLEVENNNSSNSTTGETSATPRQRTQNSTENNRRTS